MPRNSTLYVSNFPKKLSDRDKEDLLRHFGAKAVRCMPSGCRYEGTAFATFDDVDEAEQALHQLHQLQVLGRLLRAEFAKDSHAVYKPAELHEQPGNQANVSSDKNEPDSRRAAEQLDAGGFQELNHISDSWNVGYPANPTLHYKYPAPTVTILTNIACALASVPRFYVQTLHLMNKMNLPAPFGFISPAPLLLDDRSLHLDEIEERAMDISESSEESELEDDATVAGSRDAPAARRPTVEARSKRRSLHVRHTTAPKRSRLHAQREAVARPRPGLLKHVDLSSIFDNAILQEQRKIAIKVGGCGTLTEVARLQQQQVEQQQQPVTDSTGGLLAPDGAELMKTAAQPSAYKVEPCQTQCIDRDQVMPVAAEMLTSAVLQPPKSVVMPTSTSPGLLSVSAGALAGDLLSLLESGFGGAHNSSSEVSAPPPHPSVTAIAVNSTPGSSSSRHKQLTQAEMNEFPVFKNYTRGDPCARIYVKNLSKQVTEQELRSLLAESVIETKDIVDVRLMTEGRMKGQAFITFADAGSAARALEYTNGLMLHEKPMVVMFAKSAKSA